MSSFKTLASLALLVSTRLALVQAGVYVTSPVQSTVWTGGQSYEVDWVDDGQSPLLSAIGECNVALYNSDDVLVQSLASVNVADATSLSFTPNPSAGGNGGYYVVFTSTSGDYTSWSGDFTLNGMSGSGSSSVVGSSTVSGSSIGSTTTTVDSSTSVANSTSLGGTSTGAPSTTPTSPTTTSASSSVPSTVSAGTSTSTRGSSATPSSTQSGAAIRSGASTSLAGGLILALAGAIVF
ncbi:hypothetical protein BD769DRAFT_665329 [Suillus cothurnatus]|nr:hypothetical protein BD769DRAFT_665329 [Suillus cothurnatus]